MSYITKKIKNMAQNIKHIKKVFGDIVDPTIGRSMTTTTTNLKALVAQSNYENTKATGLIYLAHIKDKRIKNIEIEDIIEYNAVQYEVKKIMISPTGEDGCVHFG